MSWDWGNWGGFTHVRSRASWRRRIVLSIVSLAAGLTLMAVTARFGGGGDIPILVAGLLVLLVLGVLFGLRPWARD